MPEERRPSIDERLQSLAMRLQQRAKQSEEQGKRFDRLHRWVIANDRECKRFRHALRAGLEAYRGGRDVGKGE